MRIKTKAHQGSQVKRSDLGVPTLTHTHNLIHTHGHIITILYIVYACICVCIWKSVCARMWYLNMYMQTSACNIKTRIVMFDKHTSGRQITSTVSCGMTHIDKSQNPEESPAHEEPFSKQAQSNESRLPVRRFCHHSIPMREKAIRATPNPILQVKQGPRCKEGVSRSNSEETIA